MAKKKSAAAASVNAADSDAKRVTGAMPLQLKMTKTESRSIVNNELGRRVKLADFRSTVTPLTAAERELLVDQAIEVLDKTYAHLPLKRALHANDPIQSLKLLRLRHSTLDERAFQSAMIDVFVGLRDLHTNYILPDAYRTKFAFLPFRIEEYYEPGGVASPSSSVTQRRQYIVSWVSPVNTVTSLKEGMIVTHWNGSPIDLAVARNGSREAGSNLDARRAQGVEALTLRWLGMSLPPDEDWVNLTYTNGAQNFESRFDWEIIDSDDAPTLLAGSGGASGLNIGLDLKRLRLDRVRKRVFDPSAVQVESQAAKMVERAVANNVAPPPMAANTSVFPDVFPRFGEVTTPSGKFGYIRLKTFAPDSNDPNLIENTVREFARILALLPSRGLILDVRGNGGGYINIGELMLQLLTPRKIVPEGFHFLATPTTLSMTKATANELQDWTQTIIEGLESGASYSQGFPLTDPEQCNSIGQVYQGPVVLVTDALCYSTTDIFTAGFQDHEIGPVLGCHASTGAGGANVWEYARDLQNVVLEPANPFVALPKGADMRVAIRRCTRIGQRNGTPVEDYGVTPDFRYYLTKADVAGNNEDLIAAAAKILKGLPQQTVHLTPNATDPRQKFKIDSSNIDRVDMFISGRPVLSLDVTTSSTTAVLPAPAAAGSSVSANGYRQGDLVVSTRLQV